MKNYKIAVLSAVAAGSFAGLDASAQFSYTQGDLMLGIRNGTSSGSDMVVDIGTAANLVAAATSGGGSTPISGTYYSSAQFTASGIPIDSMYYSVFGDTSGNTLWATASSPLSEHNSFSQSIGAGQFEAIATGAGDYPGYYPANGANSANVTIMPNSFNLGTDLSYTQGIKDPNTGLATYGYFPVVNEANTVAGFAENPFSPYATVNLYRLDPAANGTPGTVLGYFQLTPTGTMTFNLGVAPVPEPNTLALLGAGLLTLTAVRRFKTQK